MNMALRRERPAGESASGAELELLARLVERAGDGVAIADLEGVVVQVNPACERLTGWPRGDVVGQSALVFASGPPDIDRALSVARSGGAWRGEVEYLRRGGARFWVDLSVFPVTSAGEATRIVMVQRDVTPRRRLLDDLEGSYARYRQLFESASDLILLADEQGALIRANAATCEALAIDADDLVGRNLESLVALDQHALLQELLGRLRSGERAVFAELELVGAERRRVIVEASLARSGHGAFELLVAVCRDARSRQQIERSASTARLHDLGRLASTVAHEIRNPLSSVKIAVQALERSGTPLDEKDRRRLAIASREILSMERVLNEMLDFTGRSAPVLEPQELSQVVQEALESIAPETRERGVHVVLHTLPAPAVLCDHGRVKRAVVNLCLNATQAMRGGGVVDVEIGPTPGGGAEVRVLDRGPGVPEDAKAQIFEPFVTYRARGTGLGLAVVRKVMEEHSGSVEVSDREGGGAIFTLRFTAT